MTSTSNPVATGPALCEMMVIELTLAEQFVLWAFRARLEGPQHLFSVRFGFHLASENGSDRDAFPQFEELFNLIAAHCRRDLWFHRRRCCLVSPDEQTILTLIAAQQAGEHALARHCVGVLVVDQAMAMVLCSARRFGAGLAHNGLILPLRKQQARPTVASASVH